VLIITSLKAYPESGHIQTAIFFKKYFKIRFLGIIFTFYNGSNEVSQLFPRARSLFIYPMPVNHHKVLS
jgi:hypothetical protein